MIHLTVRREGLRESGERERVCEYAYICEKKEVMREKCIEKMGECLDVKKS